MKQANIEWQQFDDQLDPRSVSYSEQSVPLDGISLSTTDNIQHTSPRSKFYELAIAFIFIYSIVGFLIWQRTHQRIGHLETEIGSLHSQFSKAQEQAITESVSPPYALSQIFITSHFRFILKGIYEPVIEAIAATNDQNYVELRNTLGLTISGQIERTTILIEAIEATAATGVNDEEQHTIRITWPESVSKIAEREDADWLSRQIMMELSDIAFKEALGNHTVKEQWNVLVEALKNHIQIPYSDEPTTAQVLSSYLSFEPNATSSFNRLANGHQLTSFQNHTLIEFILTQYGDDLIPILLDAFTKHDDWETLAPAVFNMTAPEFESAWHEYLRQTYPND